MSHKYAFPILILIIIFISFLIITNSINYTNGSINWTLSFNFSSLYTLNAFVNYIIYGAVILLLLFIYNSFKAVMRF